MRGAKEPFERVHGDGEQQLVQDDGGPFADPFILRQVGQMGQRDDDPLKAGVRVPLGKAFCAPRAQPFER